MQRVCDLRFSVPRPSAGLWKVLDEIVCEYSVRARGVNIAILEYFIYVDSVAHIDGGFVQKVLRQVSLVHGAMNSPKVYGVADTCEEGQRHVSEKKNV